MRRRREFTSPCNSRINKVVWSWLKVSSLLHLMWLGVVRRVLCCTLRNLPEQQYISKFYFLDSNAAPCLIFSFSEIPSFEISTESILKCSSCICRVLNSLCKKKKEEEKKDFRTQFKQRKFFCCVGKAIWNLIIITWYCSVQHKSCQCKHVLVNNVENGNIIAIGQSKYTARSRDVKGNSPYRIISSERRRHPLHAEDDHCVSFMSNGRRIAWSLSSICVFLQSLLWYFADIWGKFLSHLHDENVCCMYSQDSLCLHILHSLYIQYIHDTLSYSPLIVCVFVPPTNSVSSLFACLKEIADFSWKSFNGCYLSLIKYSLIVFTICWMCYVYFPLLHSVHSQGGLYYSDQCTQNYASFNISNHIIQTAKH